MSGALKVTQAPARPQCPRCTRYESRGGVLFPARMVCTALLDDEVRTIAVQQLLFTVARELARRGRCPNFAPVNPDDMPDSYRAKDIAP